MDKQKRPRREPRPPAQPVQPPSLEEVERRVRQIQAFIQELNERKYPDDGKFRYNGCRFPAGIDLRKIASKYTAKEAIRRLTILDEQFPWKFSKNSYAEEDERRNIYISPRSAYVSQFGQILDQIEFFFRH